VTLINQTESLSKYLKKMVATEEKTVSKRFKMWGVLLVFSAIALGTLIEQDKDAINENKRIWCIAVCVGSMFFSFFIVATTFKSSVADNIVGKVPEGFSIMLVVALWCGGLPVIMNPDNGIAVIRYPMIGEVIENPNLYFSSWASLIASILILGNFMQQSSIAGMSKVPAKFNKWIHLMAASIAVLASSVDIYQDSCDDDKSTATCKRAVFAFSLGAAGTACSFFMVTIYEFFRPRLSIVVEAFLTVVLFALYCVGVAYTTSSDGPGDRVGTLYFAMWYGLFAAYFLACSSCVKDMFFGNNVPVATEPGASEINESKTDDNMEQLNVIEGEEIPAEAIDEEEGEC